MNSFSFVYRALVSLALVWSFGVSAQTVKPLPTDTAASKKILSDYFRLIPELQYKFASKAKTPLLRSSLNLQSANLALELASNNSVTSLSTLSQYDPPPGPIGFCFGRAFATQTFASMQGLKESSIRKLFIIGDLRSDPAQPEWGFHVTTLVLGDDQKWYAIDPIYANEKGKNLPIAASVWIKWVRDNWDRWHNGAPRAFLYLTEASAMMPDVRNYPDGIIDSVKFKQEKYGITQDSRVSTEFRDNKVFVLTPEQTDEHFLHFNGRRDDKNFDFTHLVIQDQTFDFLGYFSAFNKTLLDPTGNIALSATARFRLPRSKPLGLSFRNFQKR